jgi:hypothetical protein
MVCKNQRLSVFGKMGYFFVYTDGGPRDFSPFSRNPSSLFCRVTSHNNATAPLILGFLRFSYNYAPFDFPVSGETRPPVSIPMEPSYIEGPLVPDFQVLIDPKLVFSF